MSEDKYPIVVRNLFNPETHQAIQGFIEDYVPMMSIGRDSTQFVRSYVHNAPFFVAIHKQLAEFASELFVVTSPGYASD